MFQKVFWIKPKEITKLIDSPTLIHLRGKEDQPLFISILLHGNEFSGLFILQKILTKYRHQALPKSLIIFFANQKACEQGLRQLKNQPDFNRIWKGGSSYEKSLTEPVLQYAKDQKIQAAIDIHNNTGKNPVYACINKKKEEFIKTGSDFFRKDCLFYKTGHCVIHGLFPSLPFYGYGVWASWLCPRHCFRHSVY